MEDYKEFYEIFDKSYRNIFTTIKIIKYFLYILGH